METLSPPVWSTVLSVFDYRSLQNFVDFTKASFLDAPECNDFGIQYEVVDDNNNPVSEDDVQIFINQMPVSSNVRVTAGIGEYYYKIVATSPYGTATSQDTKVII